MYLYVSHMKSTDACRRHSQFLMSTCQTHAMYPQSSTHRAQDDIRRIYIGLAVMALNHIFVGWQDFLRNNRGIDDGADLPEGYMSELYDRIVNNEIKMKVCLMLLSFQG